MSAPINASLPGSEDASARIDRLPATRYIWTLVVLVSFGAFFEIYDLALTAPLGLGLKEAGIFHMDERGLFGLSDQATFIAATFAGLWLGTIGFSAIADRYGRRPIFTYSLVWYALATVIMGLQSSAAAIDFWRFAASIGVGVELVAIDCYLAELMPKAHRGRAFAISTSIQFMSAPLVAVLAWQLIPHAPFGVDGWRWLALFPAVGAVLVWWIRRALPESPRWLQAHGRANDADRVLRAIESRVEADLGHALPPAQTPASIEANLATAKPSLFRPPYRARTLTLIVFHLFQAIGYFGFSNWLPTLLVSQGITVTKSLGYTAILALVPPIAPLIYSRFADRVERKTMIVVGALAAASFGLMMTQMSQGSSLVVFGLIGIGLACGNSMMSFGYHAYQSELFPTAIRARGIGLVYSFSRLTAIGSGYLIAFVLAEAGSAGVFVVISAAMVIVALTIGLFGPRTRGLALEDI